MVGSPLWPSTQPHPRRQVERQPKPAGGGEGTGRRALLSGSGSRAHQAPGARGTFVSGARSPYSTTTDKRCGGRLRGVSTSTVFGPFPTRVVSRLGRDFNGVVRPKSAANERP